MIDYKELPNGFFELLEDYHEDGIEIAKGFVWDGPSIPKYLRWLVRPTKLQSEASLVHDFLYASGNGVKRVVADKIFRYKLLEDSVKPVKAWAMWIGVRAFGWMFFQD